MSTFFIQHDNGIPLSISGVQENITDVIVTEDLANDFYSARENLSDWIIIDNTLVKDDMGVGVGTGKLKNLLFSETKPNKPCFIIVPNYDMQVVNLYFPIDHAKELENKSTTLYIDSVPYTIFFNSFDNGHLRLLVSITPSSTLFIDDLIRNVVLLQGYFPNHLKDKDERILYVTEKNGIIVLPEYLQNKCLYITDIHNPNIIHEKIKTNGVIHFCNKFKMMVDGYELRIA